MTVTGNQISIMESENSRLKMAPAIWVSSLKVISMAQVLWLMLMGLCIAELFRMGSSMEKGRWQDQMVWHILETGKTQWRMGRVCYCTQMAVSMTAILRMTRGMGKVWWYTQMAPKLQASGSMVIYISLIDLIIGFQYWRIFLFVRNIH